MEQKTTKFIQYGKQTIEEEDIGAIVDVFRENKFLTTGPRVKQFEDQVCQMTQADFAIAVSNGTTALHCAVNAINLQPGEEVIVPAITFAATANCVLYEKGVPVFCDIIEETLNIDPTKIEELITPKTRAIIMVDMCGQIPDYLQIRKICQRHNLVLIEDSAHTIGLQVKSLLPNQPYVGNIADLTTFSFHPVKNMTTGEGGMITTNNEVYAKRMFQFRNHGINTEYQNRKLYEYDISELGYNYRLTDFQCALGISQLRRVKKWVSRRQEIAKIYDDVFEQYSKLFKPLVNKFDCAYHLYIIRLNLENLDCDRDQIFKELKEHGIGVNLHYKPVYLHSLYQKLPEIKSDIGLCPSAESVYQRMITIPLFPTLTPEEINTVIIQVINVITSHSILSQV